MQTVPPNPPSVSSNHGSHPVGTNTSAMLELRISSVFVRLYPPTPQDIDGDAVVDAAMTPGPYSTSNAWIRLLQGPLEEFVKYSREEASQWLIDIAHDICDPDRKRGWLEVWKEAQQQWSRVSSTEPLTASSYRYDCPAGTTIGLSKISQRTGKSKTDANGNASTMRNDVIARDNRKCWVTRCLDVVNTHICPKRMGDHDAQNIYQTFTGVSLSGLSIYDQVFGFCLIRVLDMRFDEYELGFRCASRDQYECHVFSCPQFEAEPGSFKCTILGHIPDDLAKIVPPLHGHPAIPPCPQSRSLPPPGLFRWHYLQCVIKKFGHDDYKSLQNINFCEQPLPMEGDSDDDGTDSEADWPSKMLDLGRAAETEHEEREERNRAVAAWIQETT